MRITEIMTRDVHCGNPGDSLNEVSRLMWDHDCGFVPVVDAERRVVGIVTDRDVCMAAYTKGRPLQEIGVQEAMSGVPHCARDTDGLDTVHRLMRRLQVRRLPIVDREGRLVGLIGLADLARAALRTPDATPDVEEFVSTFEHATRPRRPTEAVARPPVEMPPARSPRRTTRAARAS